MKAVFLRVAPYGDDALHLPVADIESAALYYERVFGFQVVSRQAAPYPAAVLARDAIEIGLAQNGGDPTQEGCFFEVDSLDAAFAELEARGARPGAIGQQRVNGLLHRTFFVVAPDGLCFMIGQPQR